MAKKSKQAGLLTTQNIVIGFGALIVFFVVYDVMTSPIPTPKKQATPEKTKEEVEKEENAYKRPPPTPPRPETPEIKAKKAARFYRVGMKHFVGVPNRPKNVEKAFEYVEMAAEAGDNQGQYIVAHCQLFGYGTPQDTVKAKASFEKTMASSEDEEGTKKMKEYVEKIQWDQDYSKLTQEQKEELLPFDTGKGTIDERQAAKEQQTQSLSDEFDEENGYDDSGEGDDVAEEATEAQEAPKEETGAAAGEEKKEL